MPFEGQREEIVSEKICQCKGIFAVKDIFSDTLKPLCEIL